MLKIAGIILIVLSSSQIGFMLASRLERRKKVLTGFKDALSMLESEIGFAKNSPAQAFYNISKTVTQLGRFFDSVCIRLNGEKKCTSDAWNETVDEYKRELCLTQTDVQVLKGFCTRLGKSDVENELKNIRNTMVSINMQLAAATNDCDSNKRMYQSAGVLCGILAAVLLV